MKRLTAQLAAAVIGMLALASHLDSGAIATAAPLVINSSTLPLDRDDPSRDRVGELVYRGGLVLTSSDAHFGGISGMRVRSDGAVLTISDTGSWISFRLIEQDEMLRSVEGIAIAPLLDDKGRAGGKADRDAEALEYQLAGGGYATVAFEGSNSLWTYHPVDPLIPDSFATPASDIERPAAMAGWPGNGGPETLCDTPRGRLIIAEDATRADGSRDMLLGDMRLAYHAPSGYKPTDCQMTPDGKSVLILHRHFTPFTGVAAIIAELPLGSINEGKPVAARQIAQLAPPLSVDNMEGISIVEQDGRRFVYLVSDDNFNSLQRTLLMKFEWLPVKQ